MKLSWGLVIYYYYNYYYYNYYYYNYYYYNYYYYYYYIAKELHIFLHTSYV